MGMMTKRTGQVRKANTAKLKYVFMVDPIAMINLKVTSRSVTLKSDDTYKYKHHISLEKLFSPWKKKVKVMKTLLDSVFYPEVLNHKRTLVLEKEKSIVWRK